MDGGGLFRRQAVCGYLQVTGLIPAAPVPTFFRPHFFLVDIAALLTGEGDLLGFIDFFYHLPPPLFQKTPAYGANRCK